MHQPPAPDTPPSKTSAAASIAAAVLLLLGLAGVGAAVISQVAMVPSALPPGLAIASEGPKNGLSSDTHSQLRLSASGPDWKDITPAQRQVLEPLSKRWPTMSALTKRRWLLLADRYPTMDAQEQDKLRTRMVTWASLSAQQRNQARLNFANVKRLSPEELQAKWEEYQALSEAQRQRLAAQARKSKGAATNTRANNKRKLARVPAAASAPNAANPPKILRGSPPPVAVEMPVQVPQMTPPTHLAPLPPPGTPSHTPAAPTAPEPVAASQPVQVPQSMPSVELAPLGAPPVPQPSAAPTVPAPGSASDPVLQPH